MAPPPTPTSLMDLPAPWLLKLATSKRLAPTWGDAKPVLPLFRTCAFFRDTVLQHRTAVAEFRVPITAERFPAELARLCAVARRSSNVKLTFKSEGWRWEDTEPHITHLLVCAMAELGGPLACVKEVHTKRLQQTTLVPAWLKVCCPDVKSLEVQDCMLTAQAPALLPPPAAPPAPSSLPAPGHASPLTCQHLQRVSVRGSLGGGADSVHIRQQLAALPTLSSLTMRDAEWMALEAAPVSATITLLDVSTCRNTQHLVAHLAVQFANLRELDAGSLTLDDAGLEALLRLPHLERLNVSSVDLQRSHTHRTWAARHLSVWELDVESFARLPLDGVQTCTLSEEGTVVPSSDAQAVARVAAAAVRRWGGLLAEDDTRRVEVDGKDAQALLATVGPLLAALPASQRRAVGIDFMHDPTPATVRALGKQLPDNVATLHLSCCTLKPHAWRVLLPSLPASVTELRISFSSVSPASAEEQLVALCGAAVRRVTVAVLGEGRAVTRAKKGLSKRGKKQLVELVTW